MSKIKSEWKVIHPGSGNYFPIGSEDHLGASVVVYSCGRTQKETLEEAQLVSASYELLAACNVAALALAVAAGRDPLFVTAYEVVSAAIKKATGESA